MTEPDRLGFAPSKVKVWNRIVEIRNARMREQDLSCKRCNDEIGEAVCRDLSETLKASKGLCNFFFDIPFDPANLIQKAR